MAEMIPESISANSEATVGEKKVFRLLQEALIPDEEYLVWYEPKVIDRYTDFLVFSQKFGLLIIEVKDWSVGNIHEFNPNTFKGYFHGSAKEVRNPLAQAREVANKMKGLLEKFPSLVNQEGDYKGKMRFPIGYLVIFTNLSSSQAKEKGLLNNSQILGEKQAIFSDDINFDFDDRELCRQLISKLKNSFLVKYYFDPLSYEDLRSLRYAIFPEVRVNISKIRKLRTEEDEELLKTLDLEQEKTAKSLGEGHRILKGVAGSGKTLVLACRVKYLKQIHPNWKILVVCYNISLRKYLEQLIIISGEQEIKNDGVDVFHFHGLVKKLTGANLSKNRTESDEEYDSRVGDILKGRIAEGIVKKGIYDGILIDEGQDFATEWMQGLSQLLNENSDSLLFCYDPAQNVFGRHKPNWKTAGFKVQGKKPTELKKSYRNTVEILELATKFGKIESHVKEGVDNLLDKTLFPEIATNRHGDMPSLHFFDNDDSLTVFILEQVQDYLVNKDCRFSDIGVLYTERKVFPDHFIEKFSSRFGKEKIYWVTQDRESKMNLDLSTDTLKLLTIESCKGLEFRVVFFVGLEDMPKYKRDEEAERSLAYVGLTRAQDYLYITSKARSGFAAELNLLLNSEEVEVDIESLNAGRSPG